MAAGGHHGTVMKLALFESFLALALMARDDAETGGFFNADADIPAAARDLGLCAVAAPAEEARIAAPVTGVLIFFRFRRRCSFVGGGDEEADGDGNVAGTFDDGGGDETVALISSSTAASSKSKASTSYNSYTLLLPKVLDAFLLNTVGVDDDAAAFEFIFVGGESAGLANSACDAPL